MKFFLMSVSLCFVLVGCVDSKKKSELSFTPTSPEKNSNKSPKDHDIDPKSLEDLDQEQNIKMDPTSCEFGWQLKNSNLITENFKNVNEILVKNSCLSCHNSNSKDYASLVFSSTEEAIGKKGVKNPNALLLNPSDLKASLLLNKLSNYGGSMPALSKNELEMLKGWIKSIDFDCLKEKETEKTKFNQLKAADVVIDTTSSLFSTSKTSRSVNTVKVVVADKFEALLKIAEKDGGKVITSESVESIKKLSKDVKNENLRISASYTGNVKEKILRVEESNLYTTFDDLKFSLGRVYNIDLKTGGVLKEDVFLSMLSPDKKSELNKIETTVTSKGSYKNGISTIVQKTKTLSKADNTYAVRDRTYIVDSNKLTYSDQISDYGPKVTTAMLNGVRSEITVNSYIKDGKTYVVKKVLKTLEDGSLVEGQYSGLSVIGSFTTTSEIDGANFNYLSVPLMTDKFMKPSRVCDLDEIEKNINSQDSTSQGKWLKQKNVSLRFADRYYVQSVLKKIFGNAVLNDTLAINRLNTVFGGNYDIYDQVRDDGNRGIINTSPEGYSLINVANTAPTTDPVAPINPIRIATTVKVCEDIMKNNAYVLNGIRSTLENQSLMATGVSYPFKQDFIKAYNLFYPADPISNTTLSTLNCVASTEASALDQWRNIFLALCISPEWQRP